MGDSLTADSYGLSPWYVTNSLLGGKIQVLTNAGVANQDVAAMNSRINNNYDAAQPGWAGLPVIGLGYIIAGTNSARGSISIASLAPVFTSLLASIAGYAKKVIVMSVPPLADSAQNALTIAYNTWLEAYCLAHSPKFVWVNASSVLRNPDGSQITSLFVDGVHFTQVARALLAEELLAAFPRILDVTDFPSPLSTDSADVYPTQPQWISNPLLLGTGGSSGGGLSGSVATGFSIAGSGAGVVGTLAKIPADEWDANQSGWQRITLTSGIANSKARITTSLVGRAISGLDPTALEDVMEFRFTNLDRAFVDMIEIYAQGTPGSEYLIQRHKYPLLPSGLESRKFVFRFKRARAGTSTPASVTFFLDIVLRAAFGPSANIGTIDFRNLTVRG
jgi:hypothetical protein